jgi:membrane dipeptidase
MHPAGSRDRGKIDLDRMENGNLDALFFAAFVSQRALTEKNYKNARAAAEHLIALTEAMVAKYPKRIRLATTPAEIRRNTSDGLLSACIGIENGFALGHDLTSLKAYAARGVRYVTLCHTKDNDLCDSSTDPGPDSWHGLSPFGREVIAEMNRLGILVDISHASDESFFQALAASRTPIFASHSCARALCDNPRNLSDEMLKALAARGGVMQMCILSEYVKALPANARREAAQDSLDRVYGPWDSLSDPALRQAKRTAWGEIDEKYPRQLATVADVVDHIDHVVKLVGIDYIGIGTDFDGGGGVRDCNDVSQMSNITAELLRRGYRKKDIAKIWGGNFMRVLDHALEAAETLP